MAYKVTVERTVPRPPGDVYQTLMDFGNVDTLAPGLARSVSCEGSGIGAVRTVTLNEAPGLSGQVVERLDVAVDDRVIAYSILGDTELPFENYVAVVELADAPNGACLVKWSSNWTTKAGAAEADVRTMIDGLYNMICDNLA